jgi:hypothetical protein
MAHTTYKALALEYAMLSCEELRGGEGVAIPDYQSLVLPVLKLAADGQEHRKAEAVW